MIKSLNTDSSGVYTVTTGHGTKYIIDLDSMKGMRIPGPGRNAMRADENWFSISSIECNIGYPMMLFCAGIADDDIYTWRLSTPVTLIDQGTL